MVVAGVANVSDPGSSTEHIVSPVEHMRFACCGYRVLRSANFKCSSQEGRPADLKGAREQQDRAYRDKKDSDARIVFEMPYAGK